MQPSNCIGDFPGSPGAAANWHIIKQVAATLVFHTKRGPLGGYRFQRVAAHIKKEHSTLGHVVSSGPFSPLAEVWGSCRPHWTPLQRFDRPFLSREKKKKKEMALVKFMDC